MEKTIKMTLLQQIKEQLKKEMLSYSNRDWIKLAMMMLVTILLLVCVVLATYKMLYVVNIATDPCGLCRELNPHVELIYNNIKINWSNITSVPVN